MDRPRSVRAVVEPQSVTDGAGVRIRRSIATRQLDHLDPFLLFDHFGSNDPRDYLAGFPMHPHRGIETVTYMLDGSVSHKDSLGNAGSIGAGDVQWMTAGSGILHEEMPHFGPKRLDGFQIWVNLPARQKMIRPRYQDVPAARIPERVGADGVAVRVIAGEAAGATGPVTGIAAAPTYLDVTLPPDRTFRQPVPMGHTALVYLFEGEALVGPRRDGAATRVAATRLAALGDGDVVTVTTEAKPARLLLLAAQPFGEPIARYGPFVMNTEGEIRQALRELSEGTFVQG